MSDKPLTDKTKASDAENAALMQQIERTIPPMNIVDAERFLQEAKLIFDSHRIAKAPVSARFEIRH